MSTRSIGSTRTSQKYIDDSAQAAVLLNAAGWTGSGAASVTTPPARPSLELMTTAGKRTRELVEQVLQSQWRGSARRAHQERAGTRALRRDHERAQVHGLRCSPGHAPENVPKTTLHSTMVPTADNDWAGQNYAGYAIEIDELMMHRDRARPRQTRADVAPAAGDLRRGSAGPAALLPRQPSSCRRG